MKPLKIIFDVDGVFADFILGFNTRAKEMGLPVEATRSRDHQAWDVFPGLEPSQAALVWKTIENPGDAFWLGLECMPPQETLARIRTLALKDGVEVYFVSHRRTYSALRQTRDWIRMKVGVAPNVVLSSNKGLMAQAIEADFLIDDKAGNVVFTKYASPKTGAYILDRPYNQFPGTIGTKVKRVANLDEFLDDVEAECDNRGIGAN